MASRHRFAVIVGGASCAAALAGLVIVGAPIASAQHNSVAGTGQASAQSPLRGVHRTPLGHPQPSGRKPFLGSAAATADMGTASPWTPLVNPPPFGTPGTMLLESDGTVLVHNEPDNNTTGGTSDWWRLTPDSGGSYIDGTWTQVASMPADYTPLYFGSAILPDGRMIVEGGEYIGGNAVWSSQGEVYDPVANTWAPVAPPPGWTNIGDAASDVLPDGTFMLEHPCNTCLTNPNFTVDDALLNARTLTWTVIQATGKDDPNDEEGWTLMPNGQLLAVAAWAPGETQMFNPITRTWSFAGATAPTGNPLNPWPVVEIGPQAEMPGGNVFVPGAGSSTQIPPTACTDDVPTQTALYDYASGTWNPGPAIPAIGGQEMDSTDGPAATLPDGDVLFDVSACVYNTPTHFFLYNASSSTLTQVPDVPNAPNDTSYATRMLVLPNGQVLFNDGSNQMLVYTAGGNPDPAWRPSINSLSSRTLAPGGTYSLSGTQLAGLDPGATYGDDVQDNTNFPLVQITNDATGVVTYARTFNWTSVSIAPGARSATQFTLPPGTMPGRSKLVVIANGIASTPSSVTVF
jgi:hypothetical protein